MDGTRSPSRDDLIGHASGACAAMVRETVHDAKDSAGRRRDLTFIQEALMFGPKVVNGEALPHQPFLLWCHEIDLRDSPVDPTKDHPYALFLDMTDLAVWFPAALQSADIGYRPVTPRILPVIQNALSPIRLEDPEWIRSILTAVKAGDRLPINSRTGRSILDKLVADHMLSKLGTALPRHSRVFAAYLAHLGQPICLDTALHLKGLRERKVFPVSLPPVLSALVDQVLLRFGSAGQPAQPPSAASVGDSVMQGRSTSIVSPRTAGRRL